MTHDTTDWLRDALTSGTRSVELAEGVNYEEYHSSVFPRIGIERYLIIVGDALRAAIHREPELAQRIPNARDAIDLRNFLTHAYMHVDDRIVWNVIKEHLPVLLRDLRAVLAEDHRA